MSYYIGVGGASRGPFQIADLRAQNVTGDTPVWKEGMVDWLPARQVPELVSAGVIVGMAPAPVGGAHVPYAQQYVPVQTHLPPNAPSKVAAGICGILLGGLGVHKFILGYVGTGILQIVITVATCGLGGWIGVIEGIIYLTKTDEQFYYEYTVNKRYWF